MAEKHQRRGLIAALLVCDALAVVAALLSAYYLRLSSGLLPYTSPYSLAPYLRVTLLAVPVVLVLFAAQHLYHFDGLLGGPDEYARIVRGCTYGVVALVVLSYFERGSALSRSWLLVSWALAILLVGGTRFLVRRIVFALRRRGWFVSRALIVGANEQAKAIARQLYPPVSSGVEVVGFVDDFLPIGTPVIGDLRVLGAPGPALAGLVREQRATEVIVVPQAIAWESYQEILLANGHTYDGAGVRISPGFYELLTTGVRVHHKAFVPLLTPEAVRITGVDALLKKALDLTLVLGGAVLWGPLLALLVLLKRLATPGAVLARQPVLGRGGAAFQAVTLAVVPDVRTAHAKRAEHPGRTPGSGLDRFLLYTGLYRLPQMWHVLQGRMSLVGPRPLPAGCATEGHRWLPNLLTVKPGITGPWVLGGTAEESPEEERRLDTYYIRNWTIWLDLQILFRTLVVVCQAALTGRVHEHALSFIDINRHSSQ